MVSILGSNPLLWCCPTVPPGTGLKFQLSIGIGEWYEVFASYRVLGDRSLVSPSSPPPVWRDELHKELTPVLLRP